MQEMGWKTALDINWMSSILESVELSIDGRDVWSDDAALRASYITGSALRIQAASCLIARECGSFKSMLEIGFSPGVGSAPIVAVNPRISLVAIDGRSNMHPCPAERLSVDYRVGGTKIPVEYWRLNAELDRFPYEDNSLDVASCCDVLEHLLVDPYHLAEEVNRVLRPDAYFLLETSPSQAYWAHKAKLLAGRSIAQPYSGFGPYGRHNRLFLMDEVQELMKAAGFHIVRAETLACYPGSVGNVTRRILRIMKPLPRMCDYLGSHIFVLGMKRNEPTGRPMRFYDQWDKWRDVMTICAS